MLQRLFQAFVARQSVAVARKSDGQCVYGFINSIMKEDGSANKNFIVCMHDGRSLYFRLESDIVVAITA